MPKNKQDDFLSFLKNRLELTADEFPVLGEWSNMANTIGSIALRFGIMSLEQIELVLNEQEMESQDRKFGEIAAEMGFLTNRDIERLLDIQDLNRQQTVLGQLYLHGDIPRELIFTLLSEFSQRNTNTLALSCE